MCIANLYQFVKAVLSAGDKINRAGGRTRFSQWTTALFFLAKLLASFIFLFFFSSTLE